MTDAHNIQLSEGSQLPPEANVQWVYNPKNLSLAVTPTAFLTSGQLELLQARLNYLGIDNVVRTSNSLGEEVLTMYNLPSGKIDVLAPHRVTAETYKASKRPSMQSNPLDRKREIRLKLETLETFGVKGAHHDLITDRISILDGDFSREQMAVIRAAAKLNNDGTIEARSSEGNRIISSTIPEITNADVSIVQRFLDSDGAIEKDGKISIRGQKEELRQAHQILVDMGIDSHIGHDAHAYSYGGDTYVLIVKRPEIEGDTRLTTPSKGLPSNFEELTALKKLHYSMPEFSSHKPEVGGDHKIVFPARSNDAGRLDLQHVKDIFMPLGIDESHISYKRGGWLGNTQPSITVNITSEQFNDIKEKLDTLSHKLSAPEAETSKGSTYGVGLGAVMDSGTLKKKVSPNIE